MSLVVMLTALTAYGADNEIYVDQSGATANIDLEQLGSGNIIGGLNSVAGTLFKRPYLPLILSLLIFSKY